MAGFIEGIDRFQTLLFPDRLEDWIGEDHLVRVFDLFVDDLDLPGFGFVRSASSARLRHARVDTDITQPFCSSCSSTATLTGSRLAGAWSRKRAATSR